MNWVTILSVAWIACVAGVPVLLYRSRHRWRRNYHDQLLAMQRGVPYQRHARRLRWRY